MAGAWLFMQAACAPAQRPVSPSPEAPEGPDLVLRQVRLDRLVDGRVAASGEAAEVTYRRAGGRFTAARAHGRLFPEPGSDDEARFGAVDLAAPSAAGEAQERRARLEQGATVSTERGERLSARLLEVDGPAGELRARGEVALTGPTYTLQSEELRATLDGSRLEFPGRVRGRLTPGSP